MLQDTSFVEQYFIACFFACLRERGFFCGLLFTKFCDFEITISDTEKQTQFRAILVMVVGSHSRRITICNVANNSGSAIDAVAKVRSSWCTLARAVL